MCYFYSVISFKQYFYILNMKYKYRELYDMLL